MSHVGDLVKACCILAAAATAPATTAVAHERGQNNFTAEILYLWRDTQNVELAESAVGGSPKLHMDDETNEMGYGFRGTVDYMFWDASGMMAEDDHLQLSGFFVWNHNDDETTKRYPFGPAQGFALPGVFEFTEDGGYLDPGVFAATDRAIADYESWFAGCELNYVMPWGENICFLTGPRFVSLTDDITLEAGRWDVALAGPPPVFVRNNGKLEQTINNRMLGWQIGACAMWAPRERTHMHFNVKAAPLVNFAGREVRFDGGSGVDTWRHSDCVTKFAAIIEGNTSLNYILADRVEVFIGATVMWLPTGVAQGPRNLPKENEASEWMHGPRGCSVVYVGGTTGLNLTF